jgi:predicted lipoprotein
MGLLLRMLPLLGLLLAPGALAAELPPDLGKRLTAGYIQPAFAQLHRAGEALAKTLPAYCDAPKKAANRRAVETRFSELVTAWGRVELLRFGPLLERNRLERFFFFPDPRGVTQRQLAALLAAADPAALDPAQLASRSVAVQGIPALEYALYASGAEAQIAAGDAAGKYLCAFARAVAGNLVAISAELQAAWSDRSGIAAEFASPGPSRNLYRSTGEVGTETVKAISTGLQLTRDIKLLPAVGKTPETARGQRAPLWRSGLTQTLLRANVTGLLDFYKTAGFDAQLPAGQRWIGTTIAAESERLIALLEEPLPPFDRAVVEPESRETLVYAMLLLKNLQAVVVEYLPAAFGINIGFNSLDGD